MRRFAAAASANSILVKRNSGPTDALAENCNNDHTATGYEDGGANGCRDKMSDVSCDPATPVSALVLKSNSSRAVKTVMVQSANRIVSARSRFRARTDVEKANAIWLKYSKNARKVRPRSMLT